MQPKEIQNSALPKIHKVIFDITQKPMSMAIHIETAGKVSYFQAAWKTHSFQMYPALKLNYFFKHKVPMTEPNEN